MCVGPESGVNLWLHCSPHARRSASASPARPPFWCGKFLSFWIFSDVTQHPSRKRINNNIKMWERGSFFFFFFFFFKERSAVQQRVTCPFWKWMACPAVQCAAFLLTNLHIKKRRGIFRQEVESCWQFHYERFISPSLSLCVLFISKGRRRRTSPFSIAFLSQRDPCLIITAGYCTNP